MLLSLSWGGREFILDVLDCSLSLFKAPVKYEECCLCMCSLGITYIKHVGSLSTVHIYFVIWRDESVHEKKAEKSRFVAHSSRSSV